MELLWSDLMGPVRRFRRRAQIACVVLALLVAACAGIGQDDSDDAVLVGMARAEIALSASTTDPDSDRVVMDDRGIGGSETVSPVRMFQTSQGLPPDDEGEPVAEADPPEAGDSKGKVIYLTFDDGPTTKYTQRILDLLDEYDAKATFFQVGENACPDGRGEWSPPQQQPSWPILDDFCQSLLIFLVGRGG